MSDRIPLTHDQISELESVTEKGTRNCHLGYRKIYDFLKGNPAADDDTKFFFRQAAEINANTPTSEANYFIRSVTGSGFLWDGLFVGDPDARMGKTQANSDAIGLNIFKDIFRDGAIPPTQGIIPYDATTAVEKGMQSIGGWGGAFYFWNIYLDRAKATVGQLIVKDPAELEKFLAINSKALYDTAGEFGTDPHKVWDQLVTGFRAQLPPSLKLEMIDRALRAVISQDEDWRRKFAGEPDNVFGFKALVRDNGRLVSWYTTRPGGPGMPEAYDMVDDPNLEAALNRHRAVRLEKAAWTPWQSTRGP